MPTNPPSAAVLRSAMREILQRKTKTAENLDTVKKELERLKKNNASSVVQNPVVTRIRNLEKEVEGWPATYETEVKRWLLSQPSVANGTIGSTLPQEIKDEISKYLQTSRIARIEREVLKKK